MDLKGKKVLLRVDLNVPISGAGEQKKIDDDTRIREALPTIRYLLDQGARPIVCSHLGRPDGKRSPKYSLEPVARHMAELLGREVLLSDEATGDGVHQMVHHSRGNEIILLENIRFWAEEEANDPAFSRELARLADAYVNDAFGTAHRKHASTYGVAQAMTDCGAGMLVKKELKFLQKLIENPQHPYVLIAGGAKVTDKLKAIDNLLNFVDQAIIGGAMAYAFLAAQGKAIGKSKCEAEGVAAAEKILSKAKARGVKILLPVDHVVAWPGKDPELQSPEVVAEIPLDAAALDIGPETRELFARAIAGAKTIFWNGPMGFFEKPPYGEGTRHVAESIALNKGLKVAGGGDTLSAVSLFGFAEGFDLLSTGGGASLKFLEGKGLPGIEILRGKGGVSMNIPIKDVH
ncbi:MAG: phosphoglycerate kinase [Bdellovibrionales bacterium]|nr:phosphoglycerate kinase [Bdellovibrionales bacterium]